jgi:hypothetical protein
MSFCRPSYSGELTFHEVDSREVGEDDIRSLELAGAGIAADYRKVMRKLTPSRPRRNRTPLSLI